METWPLSPLLPPLRVIFFSLLSPPLSRDTITIDSPLMHNDIIQSPDGIFTLGFFTLGKPNHSYLGIWYTKDNGTIAWIANRDMPMLDTTDVLSVSINGPNLQLQTNSGGVVWTSVILSNLANPIAQLLANGNFVLVKFQLHDFILCYRV